METVINWWKLLWTDQKPVATAIAGFLSAFLIFLIRDLIWQKRFARTQKKQDFQQKRLESFYAPIYRFYREAYARFEYWRSQNPDSVLDNQPFFDSKDAETFVDGLFAEMPGYASHALLGVWADFKAVGDKVQKNRRRDILIVKLIVEYNLLCKELQLEYSEEEALSGKFSLSSTLSQNKAVSVISTNH